MFEIPELPKLISRSVYLGTPFVLGLVSLIFLAKLAPIVGLVDKPDTRKVHLGKIPMVGGLSMFFAIALSASWLVPQFQVAVFLISCLVVVVLGIFDDLFDLSARLRLLIQFAVALYIAFFAGVHVDSVGNVFGSGAVQLTGVFGLLFTAVCTIGVINSINMIDGVDGLAGTVLMISFSAMAILAWGNADLVDTKLLTIIVGSIAAFLVMNSRLFLKRALVFMGDSGSMLLGLILLWFLIRLSQGDNPSISPVVAGWVFGLPLVDTIVVMMRRVLSGKSPFQAGRDHLHHKLLDAGFSVNQTVAIESALHGTLVLIGILGNGHIGLETFMFWAFVCVVFCHFFLTPVLFRNIKSASGMNQIP